MSLNSSRREFLRNTTYAGIGIMIANKAWGQDNKSPNNRVNFACIGVGGRGGDDTRSADKNGNIVAICDVDQKTLDRAAASYPDAKPYRDYRKMLDEMGSKIDAVTVGIPDHSHAPAAAMAMHLGKSCYCEKPLAHSIFEVRRLAEIAKQKKVASQMGNQGTSYDGTRKMAALVRQGAIGKVTEVHVWTNRPIWPQGMERPATIPVPDNLDWQLWLGPAPERPYGKGYHTFAWRGWWDFGTGALGDMACHTVNLPFMALDLRNPVSLQAESSGTNKDSYPSWSQITFQFPATKDRPAVKLVWYDGGKRPSKDLMPGASFQDSGSLMIGDKGKVYTPGDYGENGKLIDGVDVGEAKYTKSPGHFEEFVAAIKGGEPAMSNFPGYSGPLAETILLGNLAVWTAGSEGHGPLVEWDSKRGRPKDNKIAEDVAHILKPVYRSGYTLG